MGSINLGVIMGIHVATSIVATALMIAVAVHSDAGENSGYH